MKPIDRRIDLEKPKPEFIRKAVLILKQGGVIAYPTRCLYGLAADAFNRRAIERVYQIKGRPADKALPILIPRREVLKRLTPHIPTSAVAIMDFFWPGKVTLVFQARDTLPSRLTAGTGKIGIRLPEHPVAKALIEAFDGPLTATSANFSGKDGYSKFSDFDSKLIEKLDLVLDAGPLKGGTGSTVVDVTAGKVVVLREGVVSAEDIFKVIAR